MEPPTAPEPAPPLDSELMTVYKACWAAFNSKNEEAFGKCYDDNSESSMVDFTPPMDGKGREYVVGVVKQFWAAFPDLYSQHQLVLHKDNKFAAIVLTKGTNSGPFMGAPATNKKVAVLEAQYATVSETNTAATSLHFSDQTVMAHQLGMHKSEKAADAESPWPAPIWITSSGSDIEVKNVALVKKMNALIHEGNKDGYLGHVSDDVQFRYVADKTVMSGDEYKKGLAGWMGMAEHKRDIEDVWGAGDWVVVLSSNVATLKADFPGAPESAGKKVKTRTIEYMHFADSKLKSHWVFENSMAYAAQLGLMDSGSSKKKGKKKRGKKK
jgi:predicted ester cyclase